MNYKKINNITGWIVGLIACTVYLLTKEKSASFWDCGEFLSCAYKLEVPHSPGAPFFSILGRIFTLFTDAKHAAAAVNSLSALASGFTILFLFWSITHFAKRIYNKTNEDLSQGNVIAIMAAGVVGALAYCFSDTFWFSAVEGEVYAMSSFLTALVFWAILKWEDELNNPSNPNRNTADRWIVFIAYIMGLSIGVHLLNLLAIPAITMVYYFHRYKVTTRGIIIAFIMGCVITGVVQVGIIQGIPLMASKFDLFFVNSVGLPFNMGVLIFFLLVVAACIYLMRWAKKNNKYNLHLGIISFLFLLIGYSSFVQVIIRSSADVPIDMTNPDNAISLVSYLQREQYGSQPLLFGQDFNSKPSGVAEGGMQYWKGKTKYEELGTKKEEYIFDADQKRFFPRIWDMNDPRHVEYYKSYLGIGDNAPTGADNFSFFFRYQLNQMYWRYFMWNFAGRQNDEQNIQGESDNGNWISGIKPIDKLFGRGDVDKQPDGLHDSKSRNELYFLPLILGILGLVFQYKRDDRNALVVGLLFFFTGIAIVIYLNNTPLQPRERDYAYAGSFYAFCIWIGLGVLMIYEFLKTKISAIPSAAVSGVVCLLAVPMLMASKEWDDHDRSHKTLPPASARNFLECCDKDAILFTEGDNDTYPLWYLQEVEGVRPDVRIINLSLLGIDWYIDQLKFKINDADAVPMVWESEMYRGSKRNYIQYVDNKTIAQDKYVNIKEVLDFVNSENPQAMLPTNDGNSNYLPTKNLFINTTKTAGDTSSNAGIIQFQLPSNTLYKNDLALLNIVAATYGKRPIYFSNTIDPKHYEGLYGYLTQEGIIYKLGNKFTPGLTPGMPVPVNTKKSYDLFMHKFEFGGAERKDVSYDQTNRRMLNIIRMGATRIADGLIKEGKKKEAIDVLDHCMKNVSWDSYPLAITDEDKTVLFLVDCYARAGAKDKAKVIADKILKYTQDDVNYMNTLSNEGKAFKEQDIKTQLQILPFLAQSAAQNGDSTRAKEIMTKIQALGNGGQVTPTLQ